MAFDSIIFRGLRETVPSGCNVIPGTFPIVWQGQIENVRALTVNFAPSYREYFGRLNPLTLLGPASRRLVSRQDLGLRDNQKPSNSDIARVLLSLETYFDRGTPVSELNLLQQTILEATSFSYRSKTAAHSYIFPWVHFPDDDGGLNSKLKDERVEKGANYLADLVKASGVEIVFLNGKDVVDSLIKSRRFVVQERGAIPGARSMYFAGVLGGKYSVGWDTKVRLSAFLEEREALVSWLNKTKGRDLI